jgi:restriction endonuclease S subunit
MDTIQDFKSMIPKIRDILREPGLSITGMDSMRHICIYILARYLTQEKCITVGIPHVMSWEYMSAQCNSLDGSVIALHMFRNLVVHHFDRMFGSGMFSFDVQVHAKHAEIIRILDPLDLSALNCHIDVLGWVYEYHLKTGASSAARDMGQFFTNRSVCKYMVKLCNPITTVNGRPESVCDPTVGTGGFLTAYMKHFPSVDWSTHSHLLHGCDTDPKVAGMARINLFMESGGTLFDNLLTRDSLYEGPSHQGYDIILANMPFGIQVDYALCCRRVKDLGIEGAKKSGELLFLQMMMTSLNHGGRCAVVVPDGVLHNISKCHSNTRKYLLDNFQVKKVVKMKGHQFMNTGIQPSIILFEKSSVPTSAIQFCEATWNPESFDEIILSIVERHQLDDNFSLDPRKFLQNPSVTLPSDYTKVFSLSDVCTYSNGKTGIKWDGGTAQCQYNVMSGGIGYNAIHSNFNRDGFNITISKSGSAGYVAPHFGKFWAADCFTISPSVNWLDARYLFHVLKANQSIIQDLARGSTITHCKWLDISRMSIIIPSLEQQHIISYALDRIRWPGMASCIIPPLASTIGVESVVEASIRSAINSHTNYHSAMIHDMSSHMSSIFASVHQFASTPLKDVASFQNGKTGLKWDGGTALDKYNVMSGGISYCAIHSKHNRDGQMIAVSKSGSAGHVSWHDGKFWAADCFTLRPENDSRIQTKYLYHYLKQSQTHIKSLCKGSTITHCSWNTIRDLLVPIPPIHFQHDIVIPMDKIDNSISVLNSLSAVVDEHCQIALQSFIQSNGLINVQPTLVLSVPS